MLGEYGTSSLVPQRGQTCLKVGIRVGIIMTIETVDGASFFLYTTSVQIRRPTRKLCQICLFGRASSRRCQAATTTLEMTCEIWRATAAVTS